MKCDKLIQVDTVLEIMQNPEKSGLRNALFSCIYSEFQDKFIKRIKKRFSYNKYQDKLLLDIEDAFENGLVAFFIKSQRKGFTIKGNLEATLYTFVYFQLLADFKKQNRLDFGSIDYSKWDELISGIDIDGDIDQYDLNEREVCLIKLLAMLTEKQRNILIMKYFDKLTAEQIAKKLGVVIGDVHNVTWKARKVLWMHFRQRCL